MSYKIVVNVTPGVGQTIAIPNPSTVAGVKVSNGTPFDLDVSGFGTQGLLVVPAGTEYLLSASGENRGTMSILGVNNNNVSGTGVVNLNVYIVGDTIPQGTWPITIPTQTVQAKVSTVTTLVNDGSAANTQIIESTQAGSTGSNVSIDNSGNLNISQFQGGVLSSLLQVVADPTTPRTSINIAAGSNDIFGALHAHGNVTAASGLAVTAGFSVNLAAGTQVNFIDSLGNTLFTVDNTTDTITFSGTATVNANDNAAANYFQLSPTAGNDVVLSKTGKTCAVNGQLTVAQNLVTSSDVFINSGTLHFRNGQTLTRVFYATGNGNGSITHNVGVNPSLVIITYNTGATQTAVPAWTNASTNVVNVFAAAVNWSAMCVWS